MGATRWEMIRAAVFPHSRSGMTAGILIGLGRAMGETIAVALVIGSSPQITEKLFSSGDALPAVIVNQFGESTGHLPGRAHRDGRRALLPDADHRRDRSDRPGPLRAEAGRGMSAVR